MNPFVQLNPVADAPRAATCDGQNTDNEFTT